MAKKKTAVAVLIGCIVVMLATLAAGCAKDEEEEEASDVHLSYANEEYVVSGSGEAYIDVATEMVLTEGSEVLSVLTALRAPVEETYLTMLTENIVINSADLSESGDTVTVDLASTGLNGGSLQEELLIGQIVRTICLTFDSVTYVQFTVDGQIAETFMGHMEADEPFYLLEYLDEGGQTKYTVQTGECFT